MSDEDDYMSASFLDVKEDIRPGLVHSRITKRKHEVEKKSKEAQRVNRTKKLREIEEESRNAGLETALSSDNKGFAMLQKMGYMPGMKLGAQRECNASNSGLQEPIKVKLKTDRGGLGREEQIRERIKQKEESRTKLKVWKERETAKLTEEYRQRMREKAIYKQTIGDLNKIRKVCEKLDSDEGVEEPMRTWFWFTSPGDNEENDDDNSDNSSEDVDDEELDPEDQLYFINDYLRTKYFYCTWCGTKYDNENDMLQNCPGSGKDDHE